METCLCSWGRRRRWWRGDCFLLSPGVAPLSFGFFFCKHETVAPPFFFHSLLCLFSFFICSVFALPFMPCFPLLFSFVFVFSLFCRLFFRRLVLKKDEVGGDVEVYFSVWLLSFVSGCGSTVFVPAPLPFFSFFLALGLFFSQFPQLFSSIFLPLFSPNPPCFLGFYLVFRPISLPVFPLLFFFLSPP